MSIPIKDTYHLKTYSIDFETYYDAKHQVSELGYHAYARHEKTQVICVAIVGEGVKYVGVPEGAPWAEIAGHRWVSRNCLFDFCIYKYALAGCFHNFQPAIWEDSGGLAAFTQFPRSLKGSIKSAFGVDLDKTIRDEASGYTRERLEQEGKLEAYEAYCLSDAEWDLKFWNKYIHLWPEWERELAQTHIEAAERGIRVDLDKLSSYYEILNNKMREEVVKLPWVADYYALINQLAEDINDPTIRDYVARVPDHFGLESWKEFWLDFKEVIKRVKGATVKQFAPVAVASSLGITNHIKLAGVPVPSTTAAKSIEFIDWVEKYSHKVPWINSIGGIRSIGKLKAILDAISMRLHGDIVHVYMKYCGAHTRRASGDTKLNMLALPKGDMMGVDIRSLFIPREGHKFLVIDLAQIEPRVVAWIIEDTEFLEKCKKVSPYDAHAEMTMGHNPSEGRLKDIDPKKYGLAKVRILSLGYYTGAAKFKATAKMWCGIELTDQEAQEQVEDFRNTSNIPRMWKQLQKRLVGAVGGEFHLSSPYGTKLRFFDVTEHMGDKQWPEYKVSYLIGEPASATTYGGQLTENIAQYVSRDLFSHKILQIRAEEPRAAYLLQVYDEWWGEVPTWCAEQVEAVCMDIMRRDEPEMPGLPLDAEGALLDFYTK